MKKICVVTATRAEYGLLKPLMKLINQSDKFELQILTTGAHLSPEFGMTYLQIEKDGFFINEKVEMLLSADTPSAVVKSMGLGMINYTESFSRLSPDAVILLGDRYEMLSIAAVATIHKIPIVHIHGGEITEGAYDDAIRHAITKLSSLHFTSTEEYKNRVIQMGEHPNRVFNVGAIGLDNIASLKLLSKKDLEKDLGIHFKKYNYQITFHPETLADVSSEEQFATLLEAIDIQEDSYFVFTKANADTNGRIINQMIDEFVANNPDKSCAYDTLGTLRFLSIVKICDAMIGNSSSGIIEAPSLKTATINIGGRQKGRIQAKSVLNCDAKKNEILDCFSMVKKLKFKKNIECCGNPYGSGNAAIQIMEVLSSLNLKNINNKSFYNIPIS